MYVGCVIALDPISDQARMEFGNALMVRENLDEEIATLRRLVSARPDDATAHLKLAEALLLAGDLLAGWEEYEWRYRVENAPAIRPQCNCPQWRGEPIKGKTLLLLVEQGLGDFAIQFIRYVPLLARLGATVVLGCSPTMAKLFHRVPGVARFFHRWQDAGEYDLFCPLTSLPHAFGTTLETIPTGVPYLWADDVEAGRWRDRFKTLDGPKIGLVWARRTSHPDDADRSPQAAQLAPLAGLGGFISLQTEPTEAPPPALGILDVTPDLELFNDTAAVVAGLDLVISIDAPVAHLAGALGRPVWLLLPEKPAWPWMLEREDSPWYPTMRLFRQTGPGQWPEVIRRVAKELQSF